jgi:hydroxysqualene dehydroxylase
MARRAGLVVVPMNVIVIGGGFAGLSAATRLAEEGCRVTLLEGRQILGGRAYSFTDPQTGDAVDNGQHLFMGCYRETLAFLRRIDRLDRLAFQSRLAVDFFGARNRHASLRAWPVKAPWHLLGALMRLKTLSWSDRWRLRHVRAALKRPTPFDELDRLTVDEWLSAHHQSDRARRHFWDLIALACLNEDPRIASAAPFVTVLKQAFFQEAAGSRLGLAKVGLSDLYVDGAVQFLKDHGGTVRTKCPVQRLDCSGRRVQGVILRDSERLEADAVISAVPPGSLLRLVTDELAEDIPYFSRIKELTHSPILSIHLWLDRDIMTQRLAGLLDTHIQWIFNRSRIDENPKSKVGHVSLVISGAHAFVEWSDQKIRTMALEELKRLFPKALDAAVLRSIVVREHHATLSPTVGSESFRPSWKSPLDRFWVAGDWTQTGLPATIESACVSGHGCAELILNEKAHISRPQRYDPATT